MSNSVEQQGEKPVHHVYMPGFNHNGHKVTRGIKPEGESGRGGIHPWHFIRICFRSTSHISMIVNVLWPFVPAAIAIHFARPDLHLWNFILNYIAMVPTANLVGFAGQELARKLPKVFGKPAICAVVWGNYHESIPFMGLLPMILYHAWGYYPPNRPKVLTLSRRSARNVPRRYRRNSPFHGSTPQRRQQ